MKIFVEMEVPQRRAMAAQFRLWALGVLWAVLLFRAGTASAASQLQFDVFFGYDGIVPEASWFPVVCEIKNDGAPFTGTVEVVPGNMNPGQSRLLQVELPTGTLKRVVVPVFAPSGYAAWDVRLLDERGKVREEQLGLRARKTMANGVPLLGALARTATGTPTIKPVLLTQNDWQPAVARFQSPVFPDNPLVIEGMRALYLNSEKALELSDPQVNALYAWLHAGGHLIIAVEQIGDINSKPWLKALFPCDLRDIRTVREHPELHAWLGEADWAVAPRQLGHSPQFPGRKQPPRASLTGHPFEDLKRDPSFEAAEIQVAIGKLLKGSRAVVSAEAQPLIVETLRGRGKVTGLMFSPEREPFRSWEHLPVLWAKLTGVPSDWYATSDGSFHSGWSSDGIFGAMIETRQVNRLPVTWLLLLLVGYLVVIGPLDQYWVKKMGKPMLTWITFPCEVLCFSLLIYFIGHKLRAGESEWNELHVVDVVDTSRAQLRGRTYASVYAPSNQRYVLKSSQDIATLRGEAAGGWGGQSNEKGSVLQKGDNFEAELYVPVWMSQLVVSDWWDSGTSPLAFSVKQQGSVYQVEVENDSERKLSHALLAVGDRLFVLGELASSEKKTYTLDTNAGMPLSQYVSQHGMGFQGAVGSRRQAFGGGNSGRLDDLPNSSVAVSFLRENPAHHGYAQSFIMPPGLELSSTLQNGAAVLLAWDANYAPVRPLHSYTPKRGQRHTLWRVIAPTDVSQN